PVVWGDKVFITQANKGGTKRALICLARADGKTLWTKEVEYAQKEAAWNPTYYDSASPATDGERVVVSHASAGVEWYDFAGKQLWKKDFGTMEHVFGNGSSPVIHGDHVFFWGGPAGITNFLVGLNKKTGKLLWRLDETPAAPQPKEGEKPKGNPT